jgi:hypothetical protein
LGYFFVGIARPLLKVFAENLASLTQRRNKQLLIRRSMTSYPKAAPSGSFSLNRLFYFGGVGFWPRRVIVSLETLG